MNILIIPAFFQTKKRPTVGSFFLEQAKALQNNGHKVTILYSDTYSVKCINEWIKYEEENIVTQEGIRIFRMKSFCPLKHGMEGHSEAFADDIIKLYDKYIGKDKIDIIHAHCCVWAGYAAMKLSQKINVPYVITEHATLFQLHKKDISLKNNEKIREAFKNASRVICVSRAFGELLNEYREDIDVVGNVVDCDMFKVCNNSQISSNYTFLTICYMEKEEQLYKKGIDVLFKAWREFIAEYPTARLLIGGGGRAKQKAMEWSQQYGLESSIEFLGALERKEVVTQMQQCDCFVLPSRYETFGVVYIEAMACGKPVIAVKNGGPDDFIKEFNGVLIEPEDIESLTAAMKKMINEKDNYDSSKIVSFVESKFSKYAISKQLEDIYDKVLK